MEPLFVFARFLGMGSSEALTTTYLGIFQFLIFLIIFKTSIINVQLWASLENSLQISLWEQLATNGCMPAQLQQTINPVWNKIFHENFFWCFSFVNDINI